MLNDWIGTTSRKWHCCKVVTWLCTNVIACLHRQQCWPMACAMLMPSCHRMTLCALVCTAALSCNALSGDSPVPSWLVHCDCCANPYAHYWFTSNLCSRHRPALLQHGSLLGTRLPGGMALEFRAHEPSMASVPASSACLNEVFHKAAQLNG